MLLILNENRDQTLNSSGGMEGRKEKKERKGPEQTKPYKLCKQN